MALSNKLYDLPIIHHSERRSQYCSQDDVSLWLENNISTSMKQNGNPYENALAERVHGIIKTEFNLYSNASGFKETERKVHRSSNLIMNSDHMPAVNI